MKPLEKIYWLRFILGIVAALICTGYGLATGTISKETFTLDVFINGISFASITYIISYYIIKPLFIPKVEKPQKIITTGIGIYILSWLVLWILLYTIIAAT
jgi:hypothetical protein